MASRSTAEVIDLFNQVFTDHDPTPLADLVADDCVMEAIQPAPDGTRTVGRDACLEFWRALAEDRGSRFDPEEITIGGEHGTIRWRLHFGTESVRGVTLSRSSTARSPKHSRTARLAESRSPPTPAPARRTSWTATTRPSGCTIPTCSRT